MAESHVLSALKEKRARVAGELIATRLRALALKVDLDQRIDGCLKVFQSGLDPENDQAKKPRPKRVPLAYGKACR